MLVEPLQNPQVHQGFWQEPACAGLGDNPRIDLRVKSNTPSPLGVYFKGCFLRLVPIVV